MVGAHAGGVTKVSWEIGYFLHYNLVIAACLSFHSTLVDDIAERYVTVSLCAIVEKQI